ncbi:uncharacterized protein LOC119066472 [Bradysia coprophila]|uniref:uncharacterized protein LOC119066472 n=1 Tax=Bradysia coprophila TaxID=38358 RepID=UPI00187DB6DD|nr:uncharacterized protein LOC119066472 [Bradysia coprophila]
MSTPNQTNFIDLNDDCCYHIYKFLSIVDWSSLRDTCTRFRTISDYCFDRRRRTFELSDISNSSNKMEPSEVKRVLRAFGRFMKTLSIDRERFKRNTDCNVLVLFLDRYCRSLVDLELANFRLTRTTIVQCRRLFSSLQRLVIDEWNDEAAFTAFTSCLATCASLTELEFIGLYGIVGDSLANRRIASLKSFKMSGSIGFSCKAIKSFLTKNDQLTQIKLWDLHFKDHEGADNILEHVANKLLKLEALSLQFNINFMPNIFPVTEMPLLKKLEVNLEYIVRVEEMLRGLTVLNNLEDLHLIFFKCNVESIRLLTLLKSLKILKLSEPYNLDRDMCKRLASGLPGLEEIHITVRNEETSLNEIKEIVLLVPNLRRIVFNRIARIRPPIAIAPEVFQSLVEIRKSQATKEILLIFLNDKDLCDIENELKSSEIGKKLAEHGSLLKMLKLDKEYRRTLSNYWVRMNPAFCATSGAGFF